MRPLRTATSIMAFAVIATVASCTPHPIGAARTLDSYTAKARTTAEGVLSVVQTVKATGTAFADNHATGPYAAQTVSGQEDIIHGLAGTLLSIQPPNPRADDIRDDLDGRIQSAIRDVGEVRIALRREDKGSLRNSLPNLDGDIAALNDFLDAHQ